MKVKALKHKTLDDTWGSINKAGLFYEIWHVHRQPEIFNYDCTMEDLIKYWSKHSPVVEKQLEDYDLVTYSMVQIDNLPSVISVKNYEKETGMRIVNIILDELKRRNMTRAKFARLMKVDTGAITRWLNGDNNFKLSTLIEIELKLNIKLIC